MSRRFGRELEMYPSAFVFACLLSTVYVFAVSLDNEAAFDVQENDINNRGELIIM